MKHGTESGYRMHRYAGEDACQPCKDGHKAAQRERRVANSPGYQRAKAKSRALSRLGAEHPERLEELIREEMGRSS